jgi:hypothetical protein
MKKTIPFVPLSILATILAAGCVPLEPQQPAQNTRSLSYTLPVLTPVEPEKQNQEKDGVRISVAPYTYSPKTVMHTQVQTIPTIIAVNNMYPAKEYSIPTIEVTPKDVRFKVTIYNRLERVVRTAGTAVAFQVAGKTVAVDKAGYEDFLNGIILPRQQGDYEIVGPAISDLPDNATIGLFLYDMVTATDAAGNPTQRSNFEFYYTLSKQAKTENAPITIRRVYVNQAGQVVGNRQY